MANRTDPLMNSISGNDPQNLLEYITRQRIYDCRYWKEICFGLTIENVLEYASNQNTFHCIGSLPYTKFICLLLKLLQLHAEHDTIASAFVQFNQQFKYAKALGLLYIRLTSRPHEIYETLDPYYNDYSKLRMYSESGNGDESGSTSSSVHNPFTIITMDVFVHQLLTSVSVMGITLPRLPQRKSLQETGYIPDGMFRPTSTLHTVLKKFQQQYMYQQQPEQGKEEGEVGTGGGNKKNKKRKDPKNKNDDETDEEMIYKNLIQYLKYKAEIEKCPTAIMAYEKRHEQPSTNTTLISNTNTTSLHVLEDGEMNEEMEDALDPVIQRTNNNNNENNDHVDDDDTKKMKRKKGSKKESKHPSKDHRNYNHLFKQEQQQQHELSHNNHDERNENNNKNNNPNRTTTTTTTNHNNNNNNNTVKYEEGSEEYWNEQRLKLGLNKLK